MDKAAFFNIANQPKEIAVGDQTFWIKKLTQSEVQHLTREYMKDEKRQAEAFSHIVCKATVNVDGSRVFEDSDQTKIGSMPFSLVKGIADEVVDYSGLNVKND